MNILLSVVLFLAILYFVYYTFKDLYKERRRFFILITIETTVFSYGLIYLTFFYTLFTPVQLLIPGSLLLLGIMISIIVDLVKKISTLGQLRVVIELFQYFVIYIFVPMFLLVVFRFNPLVLQILYIIIVWTIIIYINHSINKTAKVKVNYEVGLVKKISIYLLVFFVVTVITRFRVFDAFDEFLNISQRVPYSISSNLGYLSNNYSSERVFETEIEGLGIEDADYYYTDEYFYIYTFRDTSSELFIYSMESKELIESYELQISKYYDFTQTSILRYLSKSSLYMHDEELYLFGTDGLYEVNGTNITRFSDFTFYEAIPYVDNGVMYIYIETSDTTSEIYKLNNSELIYQEELDFDDIVFDGVSIIDDTAFYYDSDKFYKMHDISTTFANNFADLYFNTSDNEMIYASIFSGENEDGSEYSREYITINDQGVVRRLTTQYHFGTDVLKAGDNYFIMDISGLTTNNESLILDSNFKPIGYFETNKIDSVFEVDESESLIISGRVIDESVEYLQIFTTEDSLIVLSKVVIEEVEIPITFYSSYGFGYLIIIVIVIVTPLKKMDFPIKIHNYLKKK